MKNKNREHEKLWKRKIEKSKETTKNKGIEKICDIKSRKWKLKKSGKWKIKIENLKNWGNEKLKMTKIKNWECEKSKNEKL